MPSGVYSARIIGNMVKLNDEDKAVLNRYTSQPRAQLAVIITPPYTIHDDRRLWEMVYKDVKGYFATNYVSTCLAGPPELGAGGPGSHIFMFFFEHREQIVFWLSKVGLLYKGARGLYRAYGFISRKRRLWRNRRWERQWSRTRPTISVRLRLESCLPNGVGFYDMPSAARAMQDLLILMPGLQKLMDESYGNFSFNFTVSAFVGERWQGLVVFLGEGEITLGIIKKIINRISKVDVRTQPRSGFTLKRWWQLAYLKKIKNLQIVY